MEHATPQQANITHELVELENKKNVLERVLKIARAMESLQNSLETVVLLSKPVRSLPHHALKLYESLGEATQYQPTHKLKQTLDKLDDLIKNDLGKIMDIVNAEHLQQFDSNDASAVSVQSFSDGVEKRVDNFRRIAHTAVALRVLLKERKVPTTPVEYTIPAAMLREKFLQMKGMQENYRRKVDNEIAQLMAQTEQLLQRPESADSSKAAAKMLLALLRSNLDHLRAGKEISDMPFFVDVVELKSDMLETHQPAQNMTADNNKGPESIAAQVSRKKYGVIIRFLIWLTTPSDVTWKAVNRMYKK